MNDDALVLLRLMEITTVLKLRLAQMTQERDAAVARQEQLQKLNDAGAAELEMVREELRQLEFYADKLDKQLDDRDAKISDRLNDITRLEHLLSVKDQAIADLKRALELGTP